ncbi:MAG: NAD(P)-dependent oxidoreductase, partial [Deltaproteobacteria bacterium]|nr:NAD(P)-dependent oxidoreductase [Deltaproteobacteria bacterium]
ADAGRDILYVKDAVAAVVRALDTPEARGLYNIASGHRLTLREQAETIARVFGPPAAPPAVTFRPEKPNSIETYVYDISRAQRELGWTPRYSFEDMLRDYRVEEARGRYSYLLEKRRRMLDDRPQE